MMLDPRTHHDKKSQEKLYNVLHAISVFDEEVGYCQGMGFSCATFLLYMSEEVANLSLSSPLSPLPPHSEPSIQTTKYAFLMLVRLITLYNMGPLYAPGFPGLFKCLNVHSQLFEMWLPRLCAHMVLLRVSSRFRILL